jgi:UDP-N-acetylmuramoyl-tripeptide--D-alanyl-D-alanine ligase
MDWEALYSTSGRCRHQILRTGVSGSSPGRIKPQARLLRPQIGVVTTVGSDHYKTFRSLEATAKEKGRLAESLPCNGVAILNADDPHVLAMATRTRARVVTYGLSPEAEIRGTEVRSAWPDRLTLTVMHGQEQLQMRTQLVGEYWATSVLAAVACGLACGLSLEACGKSRCVRPVLGTFGARWSRLHSRNPEGPLWTMANSITFMRESRAPRKTMVIGRVSDYWGKGGEIHRKSRTACARGSRPGGFCRSAG